MNLMFHNEPGCFELYKADSGALRFKVRYPMGNGFATFSLTSKQDPKKDLYKVCFGPNFSNFIDRLFGEQQRDTKRFHLAEPIGSEFREFWVTWHSGVICLGEGDQSEPVLTYANDKIRTNNIGYIKFYTKTEDWSTDWLFEASPVVLKPLPDKKFECGQLHWVTVSEDDPRLPDNAMIGGFECEPIYITRAPHNGSLCPGKYVPSKNCGFVPWGGREHLKRRNQILCGFNAKWIKTKGNCIPENVYVAGFSEVRQEPLYIGRAMYDGQLLVGKVHTLHSTCYLPYKGKEIEVYEYEILVTLDAEFRAIPARQEIPRSAWRILL